MKDNNKKDNYNSKEIYPDYLKTNDFRKSLLMFNIDEKEISEYMKIKSD